MWYIAQCKVLKNIQAKKDCKKIKIYSQLNFRFLVVKKFLSKIKRILSAVFVYMMFHVEQLYKKVYLKLKNYRLRIYITGFVYMMFHVE